MQGFQTILTHLDDKSYLGAGNVAVTAAVWTRIWEYVVKAQQAIHAGYGSPAMPDNQGYIYIILMDDTANTALQEHGMLRLSLLNARETRKVVVVEARTETLSGSATDRRLKIPLPEQVQLPAVGEDSKLVLEMLSDATDVIKKTPASGATVIQIPVTVYQ